MLIRVIALSLSAPAFAQPKADAGSGLTSGAESTSDPGSGPTDGAKPNGASTANTFSGSRDNSGAVTKSTGGPQPVTPITPEKQQ